MRKTIHFKAWDGGMLDSPDPDKLPQNAGKLVMGVDANRHRGGITKPPGVKEESFNYLWPPPNVNPLIQSVGHLRYNEVWSDAGQQVNTLRELLVIQVKNMPVPLDDVYFVWYELEHTVGSDVWVRRGPYHVDAGGNNSIEFASLWGITHPEGKINWKEYLGVLYGACGVHIDTTTQEADSYPIQWRYIDRFPANPALGEVNGYFKEYNEGYTDVGHCLESYKGIYRSKSLPDYPKSTGTVGKITLVATPILWGNEEGHGYESGAKIKYLVIPEFDGHQLGDSYHLISPVEHLSAAGTPYHWWAVKLKLSLENGYPKRLSGFNIYKSIMDLSFTGLTDPPPLSYQYAEYVQLCHIDIKDGMTNLAYFKGKLIQVATTLYCFKVEFNWTTPTMPPQDFLDDFYVRYTDDDNVVHEAKIISTVFPSGIYIRINFVSNTIGNVVFDTKDYAVEITGRWDGYSCNILDLNQSVGITPPRVKTAVSTEDWTKIDCQYTYHDFYKDRHFVIGNYFDKKRQRHLLRWSNAVDENFSGFDLYPNGIYVPTNEGDDLTGIVSRIDYLYLITKQGRLFRYILTEGGMYLMEEGWNLGLKSPESLKIINGKFFFNGKQDDFYGPCVLRGPGEPINLGVNNRELMDMIASMPNSRPDLARAVYRAREKKYILSFPQVVDNDA